MRRNDVLPGISFIIDVDMVVDVETRNHSAEWCSVEISGPSTEQ